MTKTNIFGLSTTERNNIGRERLLTCLAECGAENESIVLLELQKAYFTKYDEYLNKAELRKYFGKGHIKQVFENFMEHDVMMQTSVNETGSLFLKMLRPLKEALADSPKPKAANLMTLGSKEVVNLNLVQLPTGRPSNKFSMPPINEDLQPSATSKLPSNRKELISLGMPKQSSKVRQTEKEAKDDETVEDDDLGLGWGDEGWGCSPSPPKTTKKAKENNHSGSTLPAFDLQLNSDENRKKKVVADAGIGSNTKEVLPRKNNLWDIPQDDGDDSSESGDKELEDGYQQIKSINSIISEASNNDNFAKGVGKTSISNRFGTFIDKQKSHEQRDLTSSATTTRVEKPNGLEAKWEEEKRRQEEIYRERMRKKKEAQERAMQEQRRESQYKAVQIAVENTHAAEVNRAFNAYSTDSKKPNMLFKKAQPPPSFAPNLMSSDDDDEEDKEEEKEQENVYGEEEAEEEEVDQDEEDDEGMMIAYSEEPKTEETRDATGFVSSKQKLANDQCYKFVGQISAIMQMHQNINHNELFKFMVNTDRSGAFSTAFGTANDLLEFIISECPNITSVKVASGNVALLWLEQSDELMSLLMQTVGKSIKNKHGQNPASRRG